MSIKRRNFIKTSLFSSGIFAFPGLVFSNNVKNETEQADVLLIGDSIRMGYQSIVFDALEGKYSYWSPDENGRTACNLIYNANHWIITRKPKVIHINAGLHDIRTMSWDSPAGNTIVPFKHYEDNLKSLFAHLKSYTNAVIIWAATTPVIDERCKEAHRWGKDFTRYNQDVLQINKIAEKVTKKMDVVYNDLYSLISDNNPQELIKKDGVHFTSKGNELLGKKVTEHVLKALEQL